MNTIEFLRSRHSVRRYTSQTLSDNICRKLRASITMINTHEAGLHFELICDDPAPFDGFKASYGMFHGVRNYIACVVDISFPNVCERAGYYAQQLVMEAVGMGLGTCYVGGTFNSGLVKVMLRADWKMLFIIALGYADVKQQTFLSSLAMKIAHRHDRCADDFFMEDEGISLVEAKRMLPWLERGLQGLVSAPSSLNRQPVRIKPTWCYGISNRGDRVLTVKAILDRNFKDALVDLGIGMYNFGFAASSGDWEWGSDSIFIPSPQ